MQLVYQTYSPFDNLPIFDALSQESEGKKERGLGYSLKYYFFLKIYKGFNLQKWIQNSRERMVS